VTVSDLCRREGIKPGVFYAWTKEFMEAGKESLTRDTVRDATREVRAHERPREVGGPDLGGTDPVGKTEAACPAGALTTGGGPVNCKGSRIALPSVPGSPGTGLAYRKKPQS
jgi:hypothetical protein